MSTWLGSNGRVVPGSATGSMVPPSTSAKGNVRPGSANSSYPSTSPNPSYSTGGTAVPSDSRLGTFTTNLTNSMLDASGSPAPDPSRPSDIDIVNGLYDPVSGHSSGSSAKQLQYKNADWAAYYGMDASTAYSEALQNTQYQRTVKDMQDAGLNPAALFGSGKGYLDSGAIYGNPASSGGGGGSGGGSSYSGGTARSQYLFSKGAYQAIATAAGVGAALVTKRPSNYYVGSSAAKGIMSAVSGLFRK